jgi:geranylgeranyl diphosphate synthase type II
MSIIAGAAGLPGMIGGQTADVVYENQKITTDILYYIHNRKTAALFSAAAEAGAILAGAEGDKPSRMAKAGETLGMAFQIMDDITDAEEEEGKHTYITVYGMDKARADFKKLSEEAIAGFVAECGAESAAAWLAAEIAGSSL